MFDIDKWQEIIFTIRKNKLRTFLTAFSVAWGIFMLMILLGFGTGLQHGVEYDFREDAVNSIWVSPGQTSMPYKGMKPGRNITLKNEDLDYLSKKVSGIEYSAARFFCYGEFTVRYKDKYSSYSVLGVTPDIRYIENQTPQKGRYINQMDMEEKRKVAIIGPKVVEGLFSKNEDPIGKWINVRGIQYRIVGVYNDQGGEGEINRIFIPLTTAQLAYNAKNQLHTIMYTVGDASVEESRQVVESTKEILSQKYQFDPEDDRAVFVWNNVENFPALPQHVSWHQDLSVGDRHFHHHCGYCWCQQHYADHHQRPYQGDRCEEGDWSYTFIHCRTFPSGINSYYRCSWLCWFDNWHRHHRADQMGSCRIQR
jgi:putative ABC transport system permease protein